MTGHLPNQFGPPPKLRVPGPFGVVGRVLCCLLAVLTGGLLGFVPALLLAVRRKGRADVAGAVLFGALSVLMFVCAAIAGADKSATVANGIGMGTMVALILGAPTHFLLMDRRAVWIAVLTRRGGHPAPGYGGYPAPAAYPAQPSYPLNHPPQQQRQPQQQPPADDLQQLGELLRRQAEGGGR